MNYFITGADGQEYGPVSIDTLRQWASEGRVLPTTSVRSFETGATTPASQLPGLFAAPTQFAPPANLAQHAYGQSQKSVADDSTGPLWNVLIRCALGIGLFFALHGLGLIVGAYALFYAIQAKSNGNKCGVFCIAAASLTLVILGVGWMMRLNGAGV